MREQTITDIFHRHFETAGFESNPDDSVVVDGIPYAPKWGEHTMNLFIKELRETAKRDHELRVDDINKVESLQAEVEILQRQLDECAGRAEE